MHKIRTKYHTFEEFEHAENAPGLKGKVATQLMRMYRVAATKSNPTILELGTSRGSSTTVLLQACEERDGRLVTVDVADCSGLSDSRKLRTIQSDSTDVERILAGAPYLREGIDLLYIDSLHEKHHVAKELTGWYPFLNAGADVFFDDVDANPYRSGNRKDDYRTEVRFNEIREYVISFFHSNEDDLYLDIAFGSTGLAHLHKLSPKNTLAKEANPIVHRSKSPVETFRYYGRRLRSRSRRAMRRR